MSFTIIAAVGRNRELGKKGGLCFKIPGDLKFFKETTMGHPIFMGLNTWRSLPGKLPGREHYVLTFDAGEIGRDDVHAVTDLEEFVKEWKEAPEEMFVTGGAMVYEQMVPYADKMYLTEVVAEDDEAEVFFPEFDKGEWQRKVIGKGEDDGVAYSFVLYTRKK
ncbi:dihydrofolate reductase [Candidatus Saccharibacteria bacterium]|nr:dihydrofolate reductase [Candidatus Saccharibacteria bacterium]